LLNIQSNNFTILYLLARRIGSIEYIVLLLSFSIFTITSGSIYLPTVLPAIQISTVKPVYLLEQNPDELYYTDTLEKYFACPNIKGPQSCTYFEYFSRYLVSKAKQSNRQGSQDSNRYYIYLYSKVIDYIKFFRIVTNKTYRQFLYKAITTAFVIARPSFLLNF
jgi:hypothetical protein